MRGIVFLGANRGRAFSARAIAEGTSVPAPYMAKVLKDLARAGLLRSQRGRHGGFALSRPPGEISLLDVVNAVAPMERIERCPMGRPEHAHALCALHRRLDESIARTEHELAACSVAELLEEPSARQPYCGFPVRAEATNGTAPPQGNVAQ